MRLTTGRGKVTGLVLPEQAGAVRRRTGYLDCAQTPDLRGELRALRTAAVVFIDHADALTSHDDRAALASLVDDLLVAAADQAVVIAVRDRALIADLLPARYSYLSLARLDDLVEIPNS
jgi:RND superfamily putative drug exporter